MNTAVFESADIPWQLTISGTLYLGMNTPENFLTIAVGNEKRLYRKGSSSFRLGALVRWSQRQTEPVADGIYENMQFTLGPTARWGDSWGSIRLSASFRIWLDKELKSAAVSNPTEFGQPDINLQLTVPI